MKGLLFCEKLEYQDLKTLDLSFVKLVEDRAQLIRLLEEAEPKNSTEKYILENMHKYFKAKATQFLEVTEVLSTATKSFNDL